MCNTYWRISPEVAGSLADSTELDMSTHPPRVTRLHHRFDGWLGDHLIECFPCFLVTDRLAKSLTGSGLTGFELDDVEVSKSPEFEEMYPDRQLPEFRWLKVKAVQPEDADFRLTLDHRLEVSEPALAVLRKANLEHAEVERGEPKDP